MHYTLEKKETGNAKIRFVYSVVDETGNVVSTRRSNRNYIAATINGQFYFGHFDLIGKGAHGQQIRILEKENRDPVPVAYLNPENLTEEQKSEMETDAERRFNAAHPEANP